jgi:ribonuclease R
MSQVTFEDRILGAVSKRTYQPVKPKLLARKLGVAANEYSAFRRVLRQMHKVGRIEFGRGHVVRPAGAHGTQTGVFRKAGGGFGFVIPHLIDGVKSQDIFIPAKATLDAASGDTVLVRIRKKPNNDDNPTGEVLQVLERSTNQFVGTYFERDGDGFVRVDGTVFSHSIYVGDPGAKGARPEDKVVIEMLRFPGPEDRGEGVITEILGPRGQPGVDTMSIIRAFGLPDRFPADALAEAREAVAKFNERDFQGRENFTRTLTITIDPADARDFDDAVSLSRDPDSGHWDLHVHIADVSYFAPPGSELDLEARKRGTSVYLPQRVVPMFPELISNSLASLQQGRVRYVKSVVIEFTAEGQVVATRFSNGAIKVRRRFTYDQVSQFLEQHDIAQAGIAGKEHDGKPVRGKARSGKKRPPAKPAVEVEPEIAAMLLQMRELAMMLRQRRGRKGSLELEMPQTELEYDVNGHVIGAHFAKHDVSHQIIEEFMLAANEAVATKLTELGVPFLRRVHPAPLESKLKAFAEFARILGYKIKNATDRFALQRILRQSVQEPDRYAVHYALLRSLKQAVYSPAEEGHYALAIDNYCHFTSPIRRYPDLVVHRLIEQWLCRAKVGADETELVALGEHCSKTERRADVAERELVKVKLLDYMNKRIGEQFDAIITGVADYGFYAQIEELPVEGLVHIDTLNDDYYYYDEASHTLAGRKHKRRYRLGDRVKVTAVRVDLQRRQLDFRVTPKGK